MCPPTSLSHRLIRSPVVTAILQVRGASAAKVYQAPRCARGNSHPMIFSYGSRRLWTNAFSFCCAAILAKAEISSLDCRLSFESLIHWRMIFRRASRCLFNTSGMCAAPGGMEFRLRSCQDVLRRFSVSSFVVLIISARLMRSCPQGVIRDAMLGPGQKRVGVGKELPGAQDV